MNAQSSMHSSLCACMSPSRVSQLTPSSPLPTHTHTHKMVRVDAVYTPVYTTVIIVLEKFLVYNLFLAIILLSFSRFFEANQSARGQGIPTKGLRVLLFCPNCRCMRSSVAKKAMQLKERSRLCVKECLQETWGSMPTRALRCSDLEGRGQPITGNERAWRGQPISLVDS